MHREAVVIKTNCVMCGDVEMPAWAIMLHVFTNAPARCFYEFTCPNPSCRLLVARGADHDLVKLLMTTVKEGLHVIEVTLPLEYLEQQIVLEDTPRAPLTANDVLDFALLLEASEFPLSPTGA